MPIAIRPGDPYVAGLAGRTMRGKRTAVRHALGWATWARRRLIGTTWSWLNPPLNGHDNFRLPLSSPLQDASIASVLLADGSSVDASLCPFKHFAEGSILIPLSRRTLDGALMRSDASSKCAAQYVRMSTGRQGNYIRHKRRRSLSIRPRAGIRWSAPMLTKGERPAYRSAVRPPMKFINEDLGRAAYQLAIFRVGDGGRAFTH